MRRKTCWGTLQAVSTDHEPCDYCEKPIYLPELEAHRWECKAKDGVIVGLVHESACFSRSMVELKELVARSQEHRTISQTLTELEKRHEDFATSCFLSMESLQKQLEQVRLEMSCSMRLRDDGQFVFVIPDIPKRYEEAITGQYTSLYSGSFYSEPGGYKLALRVYLNGDGEAKGSHISCFVQVRKGEYDERMSWPFRHRVQLMLEGLDGARNIHQTMTPDLQSNSFQCPKGKDNTAIGIPFFAMKSVLTEGRGYVKNGKMFIKCRVLPL